MLPRNGPGTELLRGDGARHEEMQMVPVGAGNPWGIALADGLLSRRPGDQDVVDGDFGFSYTSWYSGIWNG